MGLREVFENSDQTLVRGTGPNAEAAAMAAAHDLGKAQAGRAFEGACALGQPQPAPALVLLFKLGQEHDHNARDVLAAVVGRRVAKKSATSRSLALCHVRRCWRSSAAKA